LKDILTKEAGLRRALEASQARQEELRRQSRMIQQRNQERRQRQELIAVKQAALSDLQGQTDEAITQEVEQCQNSIKEDLRKKTKILQKAMVIYTYWKQN
jgi:hypothetical protein